MTDWDASSLWRGESARLISARKATARERLRDEDAKSNVNMIIRKQSAPVMAVPGGKTKITTRLDEEAITWFRTRVEKAGGGNYQSLINDALRQHIAQVREPLEETLRRVV